MLEPASPGFMLSDLNIDDMRNGNSNPLGKLIEKKIFLPEQTEEALIALAYLAGIPFSEYVRTVLMQHAHGHVTLMRLTHQRASGVPETGDRTGR